MKTPRLLASLPLAVTLACSAGELPSSENPVKVPDITFPLRMLHRGVTTGEVQVVLKIGPDARLQDTLITAYTHKAFADATLAAIPQGTYRPKVVNGQPVTTLAQLTVRFEVTGLVVIERHASDDIELRPDVFAYQPCAPDHLDRPLQATAAPSPAYPNDLRNQGVQGRVVLEYYVDESGRVRMPTVSHAENELLAGLSLQAVEQWQFAPPSSHGQPVLVRVRQAFLFGSPKTS